MSYKFACFTDVQYFKVSYSVALILIITTTMQINHNYPYIPSLPILPSYFYPIPPGHHRAQDSDPFATQQLLTS